jgi:hypothetical protein
VTTAIEPSTEFKTTSTVDPSTDRTIAAVESGSDSGTWNPVDPTTKSTKNEC